MHCMRTTVDIPEDLLRRAKAAAAIRGMRLKDFVSEALAKALIESPRVGNDLPAADTEQTVLGKDCVFPLIQGRCGSVMRDLTAEKIDAILEAEDIEQALSSGR